MIVDIQNGINCWYCLSISFHVAMVFGIILTIILLQFRDYFSNFQGIFWQYFKFFTARRQSLGQGNIFTGVCLSTGGRGFPDREPPPCMVKNGRYASYWNAFLLNVVFIGCIYGKLGLQCQFCNTRLKL